MASTAPNSAEELTQAYNQAISSGFTAADAGITQTTAAVKMYTGAAQAERDEYGKVVEQAVGHARTRGENLASAVQAMATAPNSGASPFAPEVKESVNKIIESEMAFYQAWTKSWMDYAAGVESRRNAAAKVMLDNNAKTIESGQEAVKSAVKYGEAFIDWSMEAPKGMKT